MHCIYIHIGENVSLEKDFIFRFHIHMPIYATTNNYILIFKFLNYLFRIIFLKLLV